jgi:hypothetical protein
MRQAMAVLEDIPSKPVPDGLGLLGTALLTMTPATLAQALAGDPGRAFPLVQAAAAMGLPAGKVQPGKTMSRRGTCLAAASKTAGASP